MEKKDSKQVNLRLRSPIFEYITSLMEKGGINFGDFCSLILNRAVHFMDEHQENIVLLAMSQVGADEKNNSKKKLEKQKAPVICKSMRVDRVALDGFIEKILKPLGIKKESAGILLLLYAVYYLGPEFIFEDDKHVKN